MPIFSDTAPAYYARSISVIPLHYQEKKPVPFEWSSFHDKPVPLQTQQQWMASNPDGNIGLVLGAQSGLIMIDIDTEDPVLRDLLIAALPHSPWHRFGKKGMMLAYRYTPIKTHRIKNVSGESLVECLSSRTQCVLPPSIHPDTLAPYTANCELLDVYDHLAPLPSDVEEIMRGVISQYGIELSHHGWSKVTDHVSKGSRDTTLTEFAGLFAYAVVRGERTLKEAIGMLHAYHGEYVQDDDADKMDINKHVDNLIKFVHRDIIDKKKVLPKGWDDGYTSEELVGMGVTLSEENTEWDFGEILEFLQAEFEKKPEGQARSIAVEAILLRVAKSKALTRLDEDRILKYIYDVGMLNVPIATFKARLRELRQGDVKGTDHSELARAVIKDLEMVNIIRFYNEEFVKWNGSHWTKLDKNPILGHISSNYGHLEACKRLSDMSGILKVMAFTMEQGICKKPLRGINFSNGFLTQELKLIPHEPDIGMVYTLPFRYMPEEAGKFPQFAAFLHQAWGRDDDYVEKLRALQEAICVTMFGMGSRFQKAILLHGAPSSGKTQLLRIVQSLVPEEAKCQIAPEKWDDKYLPAEMKDKILNICGELSDKKFIDGQMFKDIIDGSEMSAQKKYGQIFQFMPFLTHWFASNHIPRTTDTSYGFIRRWLMLTFHFPIPEELKKLDIGNIIVAEEREAIVAWAAQALIGLLERNRYTLPTSHTALEGEFANLNNSVRYYLKDSNKVRLGVLGGHVTEFEIYNSYHVFCLGAGGQKPVGAPKFRSMMRELGAEFGFTARISETTAGGTAAIFEGLNLKT